MIYLDNAATSFPKPARVYDAMDRFARTALANPGRAGHRMAVGSERALLEARNLLNQFFGGEGDERFIFTLNCTDALNMAIKGTLSDGDHVVTSELEHNSVSRPLRALELAGRIGVTKVKTDGGGFVHPEDVRAAILPKTRLIVLTHASNVLGTVQPVAEVGRIAREQDVLFLVDAAQTAGAVAIDIRAMHIDLLAFPGHKSLYGPTGTGALYVGPRAQIRAWREGGTGGDSASPTQPAEFPFFLEGGTPNVHGVVGLAEGIRYLQTHGIDTLRNHEVDLLDRIATWASQNGRYQVHGRFRRDTHVGTLSLSHATVSATEIGTILDQSFDIAVRPGLHCAPYAHRAIGTFPEGTVRISPGPFNTADEIATLCAALDEIAREF
jgi:cysteine desulfurase family protein